MPKIDPTHVNAALKTSLKDKVVTADEVKDLIAPAALKDLAGSDNPKQTLKLAAENLTRFLEPFRKNDSQQEGGVTLDRSARYSLQDLADTLTKAAEQLDQIKGGVFGAAFGLAMEDGVVTVTEVKHLQTAAQTLLGASSDKGTTARTLRGMLLEVEAMLAQTAAFGNATRDEVFSPESSKALGKLNVMLGKAIAAGITAGGNEVVDPKSNFAKGVKDAIEADGMGRGLVLAMLPSLVDQELGMFDTTGLKGPGKLKMEQQAEVRGAALLSYVDKLPDASGKEDVAHHLFRLTTGKYVPPAAAAEFTAQLKSVDIDELNDAIKGLTKQNEQSKGTGVAARNERAANLDGIALIQAELARRGVGGAGAASQAGAIWDAVTNPDAGQKVINFLQADRDIASLIWNGATLKADSVKMFSWAEAKAAVAKDFGAGTNLDVVLENMVKANMPSSQYPDTFAFARVRLDVPGEQPFPLTVVLKKGPNGFEPTSRADGGIPFDS